MIVRPKRQLLPSNTRECTFDELKHDIGVSLSLSLYLSKSCFAASCRGSTTIQIKHSSPHANVRDSSWSKVLRAPAPAPPYAPNSEPGARPGPQPRRPPASRRQIFCPQSHLLLSVSHYRCPRALSTLTLLENMKHTAAGLKWQISLTWPVSHSFRTQDITGYLFT